MGTILNRKVTLTPTSDIETNQRQLNLQHISLQLASLGHECQITTDSNFLSIADSLLKNYTEYRRLLAEYRCPADQRIQNFLEKYLRHNGIEKSIKLPGETFTLDMPGIARELSLPVHSNHHQSPLLESYRTLQGVLHNPKNDRRTTKGVFHIVEGGLPIPGDKKAVPVNVYANLLEAALTPPEELMKLPISADLPAPVNTWVSLLLRPIVRPGVENVLPEKSLETRMFAPGSLVANLDFVESIFGNAGDPFLPENDAALDIDHWTGHSGCIILAPHLTRLNKSALGLPHIDDASERQIRDDMCWKDENELYNNGQAFKVVCRDIQGVIVTIIADNYFGYSKKEIKSQISYSANLFGGVEEEHAGGALAFPSFNLGEFYYPKADPSMAEHTFSKTCEWLSGRIDIQPTGYAIDQQYSDIYYIPENAHVDMNNMIVKWKHNGQVQSIKLLLHHTYIHPSGFRVELHKHPHAPSFRLLGTIGEGTFCHKPSTVSGGGKSEISKSIQDAVISGPIYIGDYVADLAAVDGIFHRDYTDRFKNSDEEDKRGLLSPERSLGSVIKLLTPSSVYTDEYNTWLESIPQYILALVFMIKRFYRQEWGNNWRQHFSVDEVNGSYGHELKFDGRKLITNYLRVGTHADGTWRIYKLRQDFVAAQKVQTEDDITASVVVPVNYLSGLNPAYTEPSIKLVKNCENFLFQRPDDAVIRGHDKQTEYDMSGDGNFISNFEPLRQPDALEIVEDALGFDEFSQPMKNFIYKASQLADNQYFVSSAHPRIVNGSPSKNMRYLQKRPDLVDSRPLHIATMTTRLARRLASDKPVYFPVNAVLQGRRNNPSDTTAGIRPLAVFNPIHYQELPELFMDLICSLTGKSPSTTGAGSEGALTKGPFNALSATADLNNALVSFILCGHDGFSSAAGHIGEHRQIDHDISMLIPEIWCRLSVEQRDPNYLIENGYMEQVEDFTHEGKEVLASRLGYRITDKFVHTFLGKIFDTPSIVFDEAMLKPETQGMAAYVDGINNIVEAQQRVAQTYIKDGTIDDACPPLKALIHIMADGSYQGKDNTHPDIRHMFTYDYLINSDWYQQRLRIKQEKDIELWKLNLKSLEERLLETNENDTEKFADIRKRIERAKGQIDVVSTDDYLNWLNGTLGADWVHQQTI